jgi:hypothetical protein
MADVLNRDLLPEGYYAEEQVHIGSRVEIDIATFERASPGDGSARTATATLPARVWMPPAAALVLPAVFPDSLEVLVFSSEGGPTLVAAIELVSPGNKDRPETRRAFASKCASYLQQGVGLVVVDIVTSRQGNLHNELVELMGLGVEFQMSAQPLYATAYRPVRHPDVEQIDVWPSVLHIGQSLPLVPLALDKGVCLPLDLEATYTEACRRRRLG